MPLHPAVFVDRDGTILMERHYLADPDGVELVPGALDALRDLAEAGFLLVTVTNQSGIARGLYTEDDYHAVAARLAEVLEEGGVTVDRTEYCPHHPDETGPCACRKPATGMHLRAAGDLGIDVEASYYIGDKVADVVPAIELKGQGILVRTGYGTEHEDSVPDGTWVADDLRGAADLILAGPRRGRP
ncbi:MAG: HAD family hydrolase [Gemmatimonadota bacterium]|jgi:D-glycero-D-manno-heptose 1,7-bisphosphate phosphatase